MVAQRRRAAKPGIATPSAYDRGVIVALDVGNTSIKHSIVEDGGALSTGRTPTPTADVSAQVEHWLEALLADVPSSAELVLVSVVPAATAAIRASAERHGLRLLVADRTTLPIEIDVDNPEGVGDDRLVNAYAALRIHGAPAIVVDLGTATTFDVVDAQGAFVGGAIAAGPALGLEALARGTAQLPAVPLVMPMHAIGRDTASAMQSGAVIGHSGLVLVLFRAIAAELTAGGRPQPKVILTGGFSTSDWAQAIPDVDVIDPHLTLEGLLRLHAELGEKAAVG
jgi:type III pantothenate kinase